MTQKFHPVSGSRAFGKRDRDGSICPFDRDSIAYYGDLEPGRTLAFADEWLNDAELIEFVTVDGKIIGAADRTLTADEVAAYERREWKGQQ
jgi:hypothetical protein